MRLTRAVAAAIVLAATIGPAAAQAAPELSISDRLEDRRYGAAGERARIIGFQDGRFYANGWHIAGEMGGIWSEPIKLVDGVWFGIDDQWVGPATEFTSGWGYVGFDLPTTGGLRLERTDFAPDGRRGALIGLEMTNPSGSARTVTVKVDAHSELLAEYPWSFGNTPHARDQLPDTAAVEDGALRFREQGTLPHPNATPHDYAAYVASDRRPSGAEVNTAANGHRGPQGTNVCTAQEAPSNCDDGPFGKGAGGQLRYRVTVGGRDSETLWIAVMGSDKGPSDARSELRAALRHPARQLAAKIEARERAGAMTRLSLPGDRRLQQAVDWGKQNVLDLTRASEDLQVRWLDQGNQYTAPLGTVKRARWVGAGFPDYPWMFATDGEYTAFASVAMGQFEAIKDHLIGLRDVSEILNEGSGIVTHEVISEGSNWFGQDSFGRPVTVTAVQLQHRRDGQVPERRRADLALDGRRPVPRRAVRLLGPRHARRGRPARRGRRRLARGLRQRRARGHGRREARQLGLPDPRALRPRRHGARRGRRRDGGVGVRPRARAAPAVRERLVAARPPPDGPQYADSIDDPPVGGDNNKQQDKHWIGVTPMEAELTIGGMAVPGLATFDHGDQALAAARDRLLQRPRPYNLGLFHTGCGGGSDGRRRADDLRAQHRDPGRRRGQLRPPGTGPAAALHRRRGGADVRPALHGRHAGRAARLAAGDPALAGLRRRRPARRQHRALLELPRDVRAGLGPLRHGLAGRAPAARRAAGHGARRAGGRAAAAVERADRGP